MVDPETIRRLYRPKVITTLFIGESAPNRGTFFYCGENSMLRQMRIAMEAWKKRSLGNSWEFLESFKSYGWYLDDLVLKPVNHLPPSEKKAKCLGAEKSLASRIKTYKPQAIVVLLQGLKPFIDRAADAAGSNACRHVVHFPGMGWAPQFQSDMEKIINDLPTIEER